MFEWDEHNAAHIARHGVTPDEAEEAMQAQRRLGMAAYQVDAERRYRLLSSTEEGRVLVIVFIRRGRAWRVISARDATAAERRHYRR